MTMLKMAETMVAIWNNVLYLKSTFLLYWKYFFYYLFLPNPLFLIYLHSVIYKYFFENFLECHNWKPICKTREFPHAHNSTHLAGSTNTEEKNARLKSPAEDKEAWQSILYVSLENRAGSSRKNTLEFSQFHSLKEKQTGSLESFETRASWCYG